MTGPTQSTPLGPEPGNPPPGHAEWIAPDCGTARPCTIWYGPDGKETMRWSCMVKHFPQTSPHPGRPS